MPFTFSLTDAQLDEAVLQFVREGGSDLDDCLKKLFPAPAWNDADVEGWRAADAAWKAVAYWVKGAPYGSGVSTKITLSFIRLTKANKIREHITGYGFSSYSFIK